MGVVVDVAVAAVVDVVCFFSFCGFQMPLKWIPLVTTVWPYIYTGNFAVGG